ncbi:hypothetical protein PVK06_038145 [Gossypium arboreum]|uniref:Uncharacterized protein n=1 Tax=Gossypium arboreum TaxID=29729 RepID=A0ABR0MZB7_GOSAR|nr:hypothetical protein PVK06_038145 [Gossypium arboreum]
MIQENEDPLSIPLVYSDWWVQIHDLPPGFFRESVAVQFGNFISKFLEYDMKQLSNGYKSFLRIRVKIDVRKLLKRRKKIMISESNFTQKQESRPIIGGDLLPRKGQQLESNLNCGELIKGLEDVRPRNGLNQSKMDCELEDDPIASEERNKRQRFDSLTSNVSIIPDSFEVTDGQFAHFKTLLAIFNGYADRKK